MRLKRQAITLVELLIAIVLLGMIVLGATAFDSASHSFFKQSRQKARVANELNMILDHIGKYMEQAVGDSENSGLEIHSMGGSVDAGDFCTWTDSCTRDNCYIEIINDDPEDYGNKFTRRYEYDGSDQKLYFTDDYTGAISDRYKLLSTRVYTCELGIDASGNGLVIEELTLTYDPDESESVSNPGLSAEKISFFSFSHSIN